MMPGAGHIVHMPSHIYMRVGRYADAARSNQKAMQIDEQYIAQCQVQGIYPMGYYPHNIHFYWLARMAEGKSQEALAASHKTAAKVPRDMVTNVAILQGFSTLPLHAYVRFGKWDEILTEPYPGKDLRHATVIWHYARGVAYTAKGQVDRAKSELAILDSLRRDTALAAVYASQNPTSKVVEVAYHTVAGILAAKQQHYEDAIRLLKEAVQLEDNLRYDEPPSWPQPVRQTLGAVLLEANLPKEAEAVYREDLKINRQNGWSLFGLQKSLEKQNKATEAAKIQQQFQKAWAGADVKLTASRF